MSPHANVAGDTVQPEQRLVRLANHTTPDGVEDDLGGAVDVEFFHDPRSVGFDRARADEEDGSDVLVRLAFRDQLEHLRASPESDSDS